MEEMKLGPIGGGGSGSGDMFYADRIREWGLESR